MSDPLRLMCPALGLALGATLGELLGAWPGLLVGAVVGAGLGVWALLTSPRPPDGLV